MNKKAVGIILIVLAIVLGVWAWGRIRPYLTVGSVPEGATPGEMTTAPI